MSSSKSNPFPEPADRPAPSNASPDSNKNQAKGEAGVLLRQADNEGWSDEKLTKALNDMITKALNDNAAKSQPLADTPSATSAQVESEGQSKDAAGDSGRGREKDLERRQETIRIIRQAEMEGWSDEKLVAALHMRLETHRELRERANTL